MTDQDAVHFLAWVALRRTLQESDVTQENVESFPVSILQDLLGDLYHLEPIVLEASWFGSSAGGRRQFVRMRHRVKVLSELSPISRFSKRFYRMTTFHWSEYLGRCPIRQFQ